MKLAFSSNSFSKSLSTRAFSRILFYSTQTYVSSTRQVTPKKDSLHNRISAVGEPWVSMVPVLDKWVQQGHKIRRGEINYIIKELKSFKRFKHALEISEWISEWKYFDSSPADFTVRLNLISSVHGIEEAEKYFESIQEEFKAPIVYNALLDCYARNNLVEKAESFMQKMRELGFANSAGAYNILLNLYHKAGQYEKLDTIMEEMCEKGVRPDKFTYGIRLAAYADTAQIDGMGRILQKMEKDSEIVSWSFYTTAANGYNKAGVTDKALVMLKKAEGLISLKERSSAYDVLITLYASAGSKENLYRIWNLYKSVDKIHNKSYRCMISSLLKLNDIAGAEKVLEEWESNNSSYDFRVPNLLIVAFCKHGLLEKAEMCINKAIVKGEKPAPVTWEILASSYIEKNQFPKALDAVKAALLARRPGWKPRRDTAAACLLYLKQQGDAVRTGEFVRLLGVSGNISTEDCESLLDKIYNTEVELEADEHSAAASLLHFKQQEDAEKTGELVRLLGVSGDSSTEDCESLLDNIYKTEPDERSLDDDEGRDENVKVAP